MEQTKCCKQCGLVLSKNEEELYEDYCYNCYKIIDQEQYEMWLDKEINRKK